MCAVFLLHFRSAFVAIVSIPAAILLSLIVMRIQGVGANIMSLGGIAISIGVLVDASVVMVENAHTHLECWRGRRTRLQVIRDAAVEVGPTLFFGLLVITVSFLPIFTLEAEEGRLFRPLAFTKTYAVAMASLVAAYRDVYERREFALNTELAAAPMSGSPELLIQMLDKLVDNAVGFSVDGDTITLSLASDDGLLRLGVANPGPPLPERMRYQMFESMVSMRQARDNKHLGLGLYVARLIAEGHGGKIDAENIEGGVNVFVTLSGGQHGE